MKLSSYGLIYLGKNTQTLSQLICCYCVILEGWEIHNELTIECTLPPHNCKRQKNLIDKLIALLIEGYISVVSFCRMLSYC